MQPVAQGQPFTEHVQELRRRLLWVALVLVSAGGVAYLYRQSIIDFVARPLKQTLFYTSPSGGFTFIMQICLTVGATAAIPVFVYHLARFTAPAFENGKLSSRRILAIILATTLLAIAGLAFAYWVVLPDSFHFFAGFSGGSVKPLITANEYLNFTLGAAVTFAMLFQLPLLLLFFNSIKRFPPGSLRKYRRHVIVGSLALALILPFTYDPITQFVVAVPVIALYELSIMLIWLSNRRYYKIEATKRLAMAKTASFAHQPVPTARTATLPVASLLPRPALSRAPLIDGVIVGANHQHLRPMAKIPRPEPLVEAPKSSKPTVINLKGAWDVISPY